MGRRSDARERLIEAANDLIWEFSYGAVTIDAICERASVKKGSFYYFFESKGDLAVAAVDAWWMTRRALMKKIFSPEVPPLDRLRTYLDFVAERQLTAHAATGKVLGCPLFSLGSEICKQDEKLRERIHAVINDLSGHFEDAVAEAQAAGEIGGINAALKARSLINYYEGILIRARIENDPEPIRTLTVDAMELLDPRLALLPA